MFSFGASACRTSGHGCDVTSTSSTRVDGGRIRLSPASRARSFSIESRSRSRFLIEHDLFGKPVSTFPDHALASRGHEPMFQALIDWKGSPKLAGDEPIFTVHLNDESLRPLKAAKVAACPSRCLVRI